MKNKNNFKVVKRFLSNGLKVVLIKNHRKDKFASIIIPKGNATVGGKIDGNDIMDGTAHFLEHRIFDTKKGDAMDLFDNLGLSSNAETSFDYTSYYFSGTEHFLDGLHILLDMTSKLSFDESSVEREKPIILEELNEQLNDAKSVLFWQVLQNLFENSPLKNPILGNEKSINAIKKKNLYDFFETFYSPSNMTLLLIGDIPLTIFDDLSNFKLNEFENGHKYTSLALKEKEKVVKKRSTIKKKTPIPLWAIGYKFTIKQRELFFDADYKFSLLLELLCDILFSRASDFKEFLKSQDLDKEMQIFSNCGSLDGCHFLIIEGINRKYNRMKEIIDRYLRFVYDRINDDYLELIKKNYYGKWVSNMSSPDELYNSYLNFLELGDEFYLGYDELFNFKLSDIKKIIKLMIDSDSTFVVVK